MYALCIVVMNLQGDRFMQFCYVLILLQWSQFQLKVTIPSLHESILPGAGFRTTAERYLQPVAEFLVLTAKILAALVTMQYAWRIVLAKRIEQSTVGESTTMAHAELPADNLPSFEVKYCC